METAAIIIGIDEYAHQPLTSAVNDAKAFRQALIDLNLVGERNITMLTAPIGDSQGLAERDNIVDTLYDFYDNGENCERLFFFYSGHGLLAFSDAARGRAHTALMPSDVRELERHGSKLIDLDEILERFRLNGPVEQLFFIDACRNLDYDSYPDVGSLGWSGKTPGAARRQATLYAVSELGKAVGVKDGLGRMTSHLLEGLRSNVAAVDYEEFKSEWVITMQSLTDYVKWMIQQDLAEEPLYKHKYMIPQLNDPDPKTLPIRVVRPVGPAPLTIHIAPEDAADRTQIDILLRGQRLSEHCLPPHRNHDTIDLSPQRHRIDVKSTVGPAEPEWSVVDLRRQREMTVRVGVHEAEEISLLNMDLSLPRIQQTELRAVEAERPSREGTVLAKAAEPQVTIELEGLEPPYRRWTAVQSLNESVPTGPYHIRFRLGPDVFNEQEIYVQSGEQVEVEPTVAVTTLLREALGFREEVPPTTMISESIGEIQSGLLQTMLPIIGIKPFDINDQLLHQFGNLFDPVDPEEFDLRPISIVIAVDGNRWPVHPAEVLESVKCAIVRKDEHLMDQTILRPTLMTVSSPNARFQAEVGIGLGRIGFALAKAPATSFSLQWESPYIGNFRLACASINNRATVITITLRPDGQMDISQNLLRLPGRQDLYSGELAGFIPEGRMLREIQLGQQLYRSGELISIGEKIDNEFYKSLFYAKWTDPILGCMAYFSRLQASESGQLCGGKRDKNDSLMGAAAWNLHNFFGGLPDSRVVNGLSDQLARDDEFLELISENQVPVLAEGARRLAAYAELQGLHDSHIAQIARRIPVNQIWTLTSAEDL